MFSRKAPKEKNDEYLPLPKLSQTMHPLIHKEMDTEDLTHNESAYKMYGLNAILNFPNINDDDEIPEELRIYIGKNISVPNGIDGDNLQGKILGIKNVYNAEHNKYLSYYIVLFQADEIHKQAVVKLVYIEKFGVKVLGLMNANNQYMTPKSGYDAEEEMLKRVEAATLDHLGNQESVGAKILVEKARIDNSRKNSKSKGLFRKKIDSSDKINFAFDELTAEEILNYSGFKKNLGSKVSELEFARPKSSSRSPSRSSSRSSSRSPSRSSSNSPKRESKNELIRSQSFRRKKEGKKGGKKTKKK